MSRRSLLPAAVLLCLSGAFLVLVGSGRRWTSLALPAGPLGDLRDVTLTGADLAPGVSALGLVGLAGVVALAATRRTGRVAVGAVLLLAGAGVVAAVLVPDLTAATLRSAPTAGQDAADAGDVRTTAWPAVTAAGGLLLAAAGLLTALRGRSWPALGARYDAPARSAQGRGTAPRTEPVRPERSLWEALDRGEDPTATLGSTAGPPADREADRT